MSHRAKVAVALGSVYVIWGSTYLGIELAGETIPPLFAAGVRFLLAGGLMAAIVLVRSGRAPFRVARRALGSALLIGVLLPGANGILFVAERHVPTGLASLVIASVPLWLIAMRSATGDRPSRPAIASTFVGFAGLVVLVRPQGGATFLGLMLVLVSAITWAAGSFLSSRLTLPDDPFAATAIEMLAGGCVLLPAGIVAALASGDGIHPAAWSTRSLAGFVYLVLVGSLVGYTAYVWLLANAPIGTVATYAYVNPIVAIALGVIVLDEHVTWTIAAGALLVLATVAVVIAQESRAASARAAALVPQPE